jgi:MFS family permease
MGGNGALATGQTGGLKFKLSVMMFLQFFIWGAWFELNFGYLPSLGFNDTWQQPMILGAFNLAALVAMFFSTQFADRNFAAEKFLAFSHLVGGAAILGLFFVKAGWQTDLFGIHIDLTFWIFFILMLIHSLFYVPTVSITNSIAFANLKDPQRDFGSVRVWGTIGWIVASWPFIFILVNWALVPKFGSVPFFDWLGTALGTAKEGDEFRLASRYIFLVAGIASFVLAAFSLVLPHTPPKPATTGADRFAWLEAMKLLWLPFVAVLFVVTFLDAAVHQSFFVWTERFLTGRIGIPSNWAMPVMKIGQVAEIVTMIFLGLVLKKLGWRWTMVLGILGHAARFAVFAFAPKYLGGIETTFLHLSPLQWACISINAVHGICYAFFFATVYIFIDEFFPKDARASAQGLFNMLILGAGPFVSNIVSTQLGRIFKTSDAAGKETFDFQSIFLYPLVTALVAALLLLLFFHPPKKAEAPAT